MRVVLGDGEIVRGGTLARWEARKPPNRVASCLIFYLCLCSDQRTPETRRAACCVEAGLRAFAEHRNPGGISSLFPLHLLICLICTQKASQDPLRESLGPERSPQGCRGL